MLITQLQTIPAVSLSSYCSRFARSSFYVNNKLTPSNIYIVVLRVNVHTTREWFIFVNDKTRLVVNKWNNVEDERAGV